MNDIKHIRQDFYLATWAMPQGWDLVVPWGLGVIFIPKFNQSWCVIYLHEWRMRRHNVLGPRPPGALGRGQKVKYH